MFNKYRLLVDQCAQTEGMYHMQVHVKCVG